MLEELGELVVERHLVGQSGDKSEIDKQDIEDGWGVLQKVVAIDAWFCNI
jgi:hypothetical protein